MILDWDLWPGKIAYESPFGQLLRVCRAMTPLTHALQALGRALDDARISMDKMGKLLQQHPLKEI